MGLVDAIAALRAEQAYVGGCCVCRMIRTLDKRDAESLVEALSERSPRDPSRFLIPHPAVALFLKNEGITEPGGKSIGLDSIRRHRSNCVAR